MKLWLFTFTQPDRAIQSARIVAPTPEFACGIMGNVVQRTLIYQRNKHPEPGTILQFMGQEDFDDPRITSIIDANGKELVE